jgi:prepilin-type N-terminal cleavage/methylation domain-containing protein
MPHARHHRRTHAFTLLELLSVMAILLILSGFAFGMIRGTKQRANLARAKAQLSHLVQALEEYKRHYGDYPQTGASLANSQRVTGTAGPTQTTAQARLFNALTGVYAASNFTTRVNGPIFVDVTKLTPEVALNSATFAVPTGTPPAKQASSNAFLDPWGNRYLYFYKPATPAGGRPPMWNAPAFVLYSCGPDGASTILPGPTGVFSGAAQNSTQFTNDNADNLYADKLP